MENLRVRPGGRTEVWEWDGGKGGEGRGIKREGKKGGGEERGRGRRRVREEGDGKKRGGEEYG